MSEAKERKTILGPPTAKKREGGGAGEEVEPAGGGAGEDVEPEGGGAGVDVGPEGGGGGSDAGVPGGGKKPKLRIRSKRGEPRG